MSNQGYSGDVIYATDLGLKSVWNYLSKDAEELGRVYDSLPIGMRGKLLLMADDLRNEYQKSAIEKGIGRST